MYWHLYYVHDNLFYVKYNFLELSHMMDFLKKNLEKAS